MRKLLLAICLLFTTCAFAQNSDTTGTSLSHYVSVGLSLTNGNNFKTTSYAGIETGIMYGDLGAGVVFGRGSLRGLGSPSDNLNNYFYEAKVFTSQPIGKVTGTVLFGYGGYFNTVHNFIEYGAGISYSIGCIGYGVTYSNWDNNNYVTPSLTYNF